MKIMVIDGNSILNRAFYGVRQLSNHEGMPTNAVYGFLATLFKLQDDEKPDRTVVCFDVKEKTFRHLKFDSYKATRKGMPDELAAQLPVVKEVLDAMGLTRCELRRLRGGRPDRHDQPPRKRARRQLCCRHGRPRQLAAGRRRHDRAPGHDQNGADHLRHL